MSTWFVEQRIAWIVESVTIFGGINRQHVMAKFGISMPQASMDFTEVQRRHPLLMEYDRSSKMYHQRSKL